MKLEIAEKVKHMPYELRTGSAPRKNYFSDLLSNETGTERFQDCCKNWILNWGLCYYVKKVIKF